MPELVLGQVPEGTHVLIMTHDHAEDVALCDVALRCSRLGSIGLIGSSAKWPRFREEAGRGGSRTRHARPDHHAIGLPEIAGKDPATIAVAWPRTWSGRSSAPMNSASRTEGGVP